MLGKKSILMVDRDDLRRKTRITLLEAQGAKVTARDNCSTSASLDCEGTFDLLIVVVDSDNLKEATRYAEHVHLSNSNLPILLLRDLGVSLPAVTSGRVLEAGDPRKLVLEVAEMLESVPDTEHLQEIGSAADDRLETRDSTTRDQTKQPMIEGDGKPLVVQLASAGFFTA